MANGGPPKLTLAPDGVYRLDRQPETLSERARRRQFEAQMLAREHIDELRTAMEDAEVLASVVVQGGDIYPAGVREAASRLLDYLHGQTQTLDTIVERLPEPKL